MGLALEYDLNGISLEVCAIGGDTQGYVYVPTSWDCDGYATWGVSLDRYDGSSFEVYGQAGSFLGLDGSTTPFSFVSVINISIILEMFS